MAILGEDRKAALLARGRRALLEARVQVLPILNDVRDNGDEAVRRLTKRFEGADLERSEMEMWDWRKKRKDVAEEDVEALREAARRIEAYHKHQVPKPFETNVAGAALGWKPVPLDRVGIYVPGGKASYPTTLLMAAIPAKLAGVREVIACTPPRSDGSVHPLLLAAAEIAGVDKLYRVGGAQAVFAMAHGTKTIPAVQKIVGPGNVYVQAAKQLVEPTVAVDLLAGPSEVLVIADDSAPPELAAWELAAQAEHDPNAVAVLVATSEDVLTQIQEVLARIVPGLDRTDVVQRVFAAHGVLMTATLDEALRFANEFAPEHLVLLVRNPRAALDKVTAAGSVFLGPTSPVALGDYGAGTNHILPTSGSARYSSGLSVLSFVRWVQWQEVPAQALEKFGPTVEHLAKLEGLPAHAQAVQARRAAAEGGGGNGARGDAKRKRSR
jgi:histidinol dehydrogenase